MLVKVVDWEDLDSKAEEVRRIFKGKKYVAILTTVAQYRKKRAAVGTTTDTPQNGKPTYVEQGDCKLYAEGIYLLVQSNNKSTSTCKITLGPINPDPDTSSTCGNYTGMIELKYDNTNIIIPKTCAGTQLNSLTIRMTFDWDNTTDTWSVSEVSIDAAGSITVENEVIYENKNRTWQFNYISGAQYFSYACSAPPTISPASITGASSKYSLAFKNLQVQPFAALHPTSNSKMTDNVDDCIPFFNMAILMSLIAILLLVSIILCGMGMMSSLKTMDRFDDIRAKTINVNAVN
jgi:hypothetical protein